MICLQSFKEYQMTCQMIKNQMPSNLQLSVLKQALNRTDLNNLRSLMLLKMRRQKILNVLRNLKKIYYNCLKDHFLRINLVKSVNDILTEKAVGPHLSTRTQLIKKMKRTPSILLAPLNQNSKMNYHRTQMIIGIQLPNLMRTKKRAQM